MKATMNQPSLHQLGAVLGELQVRCDETGIRSYHLAARMRKALPADPGDQARAVLHRLWRDGAVLNAARGTVEQEFRARAISVEAANDPVVADPLGVA